MISPRGSGAKSDYTAIPPSVTSPRSWYSVLTWPSKEFHRIYLGFGGNVNYFTGFVMPVGVQFTPFEKFDRFSSLHIELEPTLDLAAEDCNYQASWGLRYRFLRQE
jgi:hypothetical protein